MKIFDIRLTYIITQLPKSICTGFPFLPSSNLSLHSTINIFANYKILKFTSSPNFQGSVQGVKITILSFVILLLRPPLHAHSIHRQHDPKID